jgi:urea transporter
MTVLLAILFGVFGGVIAFFVGAIIAGIVAMLLHMSSMEGGSGFFAAGAGLLRAWRE